MAKLSDFLDKLATDEDFADEFDDTPNKVMKDFDLDKRQRNLVRHGTIKQIRDEIQKETGSALVVIMVKRG